VSDVAKTTLGPARQPEPSWAILAPRRADCLCESQPLSPVGGLGAVPPHGPEARTGGDGPPVSPPGLPRGSSRPREGFSLPAPGPGPTIGPSLVGSREPAGAGRPTHLFGERPLRHMAHLLDCECGRRLTVMAGSAGATVNCACGRRVAVPALSHLRALPEVADPPTAAAEGDGWFAWLSLTIGQVVSVVGCGASVAAAVSGLLLAGGAWGWACVPAGVVGFFYSAGMYFVFTRARR
jgi:hypothetical protein